MSWNLEQAILIRALQKGYLTLEQLIQKGVLDDEAIELLMEELEDEETHAAGPAVPENPAEPAPGERVFGRYRKLEFLGEGGMARVYKAYDPVLHRWVALKLLRVEDSKLKDRLLREARAQARVEHPNICKVYEAGEAHGDPYIAMQHIQGHTLKQMSAELGLAQKVTLIQDVCQALHEAHRAGMVHRDIKPANIMIEQTDDGRYVPYVLDFGVVREIHGPATTMTGALVGTPYYMSPEQARGDWANLDRRSDVFSVGVTLYELLTGVRPFEDENSLNVLSKIAEEDPAPLRTHNPSVPADLEMIVMKCLEKEPERRYESAAALAQDLRRYLDGEPVQARPSGWLYRLVKKVQKHKVVSAAAGLGSIVIIALAIFGLTTYSSAKQEAFLAQKFGQNVKEMEAIMRLASMLELHDLTPQKDLIRKRISELQETIQREGKASYGPGHYAIGRGYLAINDYEAARKSLDNAWNSGYRVPDVAYALGHTYGEIYSHELSKIDRDPDPAIREAKKRRLKKEYGDKALDFLKKGWGVEVDSPEYVQANMAFYEMKFEAAMELANVAIKKVPWLFEARRLQGNIEQKQADFLYSEGKYSDGLKVYGNAEDFYLKALKMAPSDAASLDMLCRLYANAMDAESYLAMETEESRFVEKGERACRNAVIADPTMASSYGYLSQIYRQQAEFLINRNEDASAVVQSAIDAALTSLKVAPRTARALTSTGTAYGVRGIYELNSGKNPLASFATSIDYHLQALDIDTHYTSLHTNLATDYAYKGDYEASHGINPLPSYEGAIRHYQRAAELTSTQIMTLISQATVFATMAKYQSEHGMDPQKAFDSAFAIDRKTIALNANHPLSYINEAIARQFYAEHLAGQDRPADEQFQLAIDAAVKGLALNKDELWANEELCGAYVARLRYENETGKDHTVSTEEVIRFCESALAQFQDDPVLHVHLGAVYMEAAAGDLQHGRSPEEHLRRSVSFLEPSLEKGPDNPAALQETGRAWLKMGRWQMSRKRNAGESLKKAAYYLHKSAEENPGDARTFLLLAEVSAAIAESSNHVDDKQDAVKFATRALALNPALKEAKSFLKQ